MNQPVSGQPTYTTFSMGFATIRAPEDRRYVKDMMPDGTLRLVDRGVPVPYGLTWMDLFIAVTDQTRAAHLRRMEERAAGVFRNPFGS